MLAKLLFFVTIVNLSLGTCIELPRKDLVILESGERVEGQIQSIYGGIVVIKTGGGEKTIVRDVSIYSPRDIAEIGIVRNKRISGHIKHLGDAAIEVQTSSGCQKINRALVRKIIISHESAMPSLNL